MKKLLKPLTLILTPSFKSTLLIWIIFILFAGQAGIWATLLTETSIFLTLNLEAGNFYTVSIALLASSTSSFIIGLKNEENAKFKTMKLLSISVSFLLIMIMVIIFTNLPVELNLAQKMGQIFLYLLAMILSIYFLCLEHLHTEYDKYKDLDDILDNKLKNKVQTQIKSDERGIEL